MMFRTRKISFNENFLLARQRRSFQHKLEDSVVELLTGLDANVNALDDVIDTKELPVEARISLTVNAAFSAVLMVENCPEGSRTEIRDVLTEYFTSGARRMPWGLTPWMKPTLCDTKH